MLHQNLQAQCPNNTSPNTISLRGRCAELLTELLPANGLKLGCIGTLCSCGKPNRGSQNEVWNGKSVHQRAADASQLTAQLLNHPLDGLGFLRRYIVIIAEQNVLVNALKGKQVCNCLHSRRAMVSDLCI